MDAGKEEWGCNCFLSSTQFVEFSRVEIACIVIHGKKSFSNKLAVFFNDSSLRSKVFVSKESEKIQHC